MNPWTGGGENGRGVCSSSLPAATDCPGPLRALSPGPGSRGEGGRPGGTLLRLPGARPWEQEVEHSAGESLALRQVSRPPRLPRSETRVGAPWARRQLAGSGRYLPHELVRPLTRDMPRTKDTIPLQPSFLTYKWGASVPTL